MARRTGESGQRRTVTCSHCQEDFQAYRTELRPHCPRCGREVRTLLLRRRLRIIGLAILIGVIIVIAGMLLSQERPTGPPQPSAPHVHQGPDAGDGPGDGQAQH